MKNSSTTSIYAQAAFTILAFMAMVFLSYFFMRNIVHRNLVRNAESVYSFAQTQLESDLLEPRTILSGFSLTVTSMISRGDSADALKSYMMDFTDYLHSVGGPLLQSIALFGYFEAFNEPVFMSSTDVTLDSITPRERPWYIDAKSKCGEIVETLPYEHVITGERVVAYVRCLHDSEGKQLGIIGLNINIEQIGNSIIDIALAQGGYGILISSDLLLIAHANPEFIGRDVRDSDIPLSIFSEEFMDGKDVLERPLINWKGERTVAFFKKISNGWYLGLLTPERPFYKDIMTMASTLILLGVLFSAALIMILYRIDAARSKSDKESRHKSQFLANMSHEIRTPMNAIIGMTTIGKSSSSTERKDLCFSKIEDAGNHLLGVINDILDMSKIEANKFDLSPSEFNFEKMLQRIVSVVNFRVDEKQQKLVVHIDKNIPKSLIGDDQRLSQVITNLLGNSIKFTPENGSIILDTVFEEEKDNICTIQFSVSDTGIGMTYEQQMRVFSSFEQAETNITRKYGGTGLGLAISKSIVELMGGKIWMVSEVDRGSTFSFTVKLERGSSSVNGLLSSDVNLNNIRIMVVDDDQYVLDYFKEISHEFNINCDTAIGGEEAIKLVKQNGHYHIYFVDWKMPGMDGIQLTTELKSYDESVKSVVIMITAAEWTVVEKEARKAGVDKFLSKPLFPSCVANIINEALGIDHNKLDEAHTDKINGIYEGRRILLVEDVEINREIVTALLEPTKIEIDYAENGKEAVRLFSESPDKYELILMDVQMPEMDGYEATRRIRAFGIPQAASIRIVAMTANVFREDIERCLEAGMDNHIGKPLDFNEIIEKLNIYLPKKNRNNNN
ncbi:MAG: response regulator [Treponema sp.]|nr:response regulator [Treponema sp.]